MMFKSLAMASAGLALVAAPVAASAAPANPASSLSLSKSVRAGAKTSKSNEAIGGTAIPYIIGAAVIASVAYLIVDNEDDDNSDSN